MYSLPEYFHVEIPAFSDSHRSARLRLELGDATQASDAEIDFGLRLAHLVRVAECGGFPPEDRFDAVSKVLMVPLHAQPLGWRIETHDVGVSFWRAMLGVLHVAGAGFPMRRVALEPTDTRTRDAVPSATLNASRLLAAPQATMPVRCGFELDHSLPARVDKNRLVRWRFVHGLSNTIAQEAMNALTSWNEILWGAFPPEGKGALDSGSDAVGAHLLGPATVELALPDFFASEESFQVVVCMAAWFHACRAPLLRVDIH